MKTIIVKSKAFGDQTILLDDDMFDELNKYKWHLTKNGDRLYATRHLKNGKKIKMHRQIMNPAEHMYVDHKKHNTLDNRRDNLRICTASENAMNKLSRKGSTSKYLGVCFCSNNKWLAQLTFKGKKKNLGMHFTEKEAAVAYNIGATKWFGDFANINIID